MNEAGCVRAAHPLHHTHGRHHPGSKFLINGFVRAIQEECPEEQPELEEIASGVGRVKGMEENVKEVVLGALGAARRRRVDGDGGMYEDGPVSPVCISESDVFGNECLFSGLRWRLRPSLRLKMTRALLEVLLICLLLVALYN